MHWHEQMFWKIITETRSEPLYLKCASHLAVELTPSNLRI